MDMPSGYAKNNCTNLNHEGQGDFIQVSSRGN